AVNSLYHTAIPLTPCSAGHSHWQHFDHRGVAGVTLLFSSSRSVESAMQFRSPNTVSIQPLLTSSGTPRTTASFNCAALCLPLLSIENRLVGAAAIAKEHKPHQQHRQGHRQNRSQHKGDRALQRQT